MATAGAAIVSAEMAEEVITAVVASRRVVDTGEADRKHAGAVPIVAGRVPVQVTRQFKGVAADRTVVVARPVAAMVDRTVVVARPVAAVDLMAAVVVVARPVVAAVGDLMAAVADTGRH
jgi:hypothetical protein